MRWTRQELARRLAGDADTWEMAPRADRVALRRALAAAGQPSGGPMRAAGRRAPRVWQLAAALLVGGVLALGAALLSREDRDTPRLAGGDGRAEAEADREGESGGAPDRPSTAGGREARGWPPSRLLAAHEVAHELVEAPLLGEVSRLGEQARLSSSFLCERLLGPLQRLQLVPRFHRP